MDALSVSTVCISTTYIHHKYLLPCILKRVLAKKQKKQKKKHLTGKDACVCLCREPFRRELYLFWFEAWGHPSIFLQSTAGVVVGGGVPLEVKHELRHRPLHVQSHHHRLIPLPTAYTERMSLNNDYKS